MDNIFVMKPFLIVVTSCLFWSSSIFAQDLTLELNPTLLPSPSTCTSLVVGESFEFDTDVLCVPDVMITLDGVTVALFDEAPFTFTFEQTGEYVIFCGVPPNSSARTATVAACFTVTDQVVPTLGEWGVIILFINLIICMVVSIRSRPSYTLGYQ